MHHPDERQQQHHSDADKDRPRSWTPSPISLKRVGSLKQPPNFHQAKKKRRCLWTMKIMFWIILSAPYEDPKWVIHYNCDALLFTLSTSHGFPEPTVSWKSPTGTSITTMELDTNTYTYSVKSNLTLSLNSTQIEAVEMKLKAFY
ncbi:CD276 antigen-like isoform X1 [Astyanax mexicanus]|uniref:CD276 antigen-like isoform X1 n=1 Tax=Astyanax mexicanus TaxID=7994 RepID=A0A8T2MSV7_ASTMX|nr:CD276 antigen-like isoform X1 [Astyanax mexicanus]KAG9283673.1 CD276 antigen-like isoform X1 [Astyanax mexicanus]